MNISASVAPAPGREKGSTARVGSATMNTVLAPEAHVRNRFVPLTFLCVSLAACDGGGGTDAGPSGTDAGPGGMDAGGGDAGTDAGSGGSDAGTDAGSGATDAGTDAAIPPGACSNPDDAMVLDGIDVEMEARTCGNMCFGGATCVTNCMEMLGLSSACATCFGSVSACTVRECIAECSGSDEMACTDCRVREGCVSAFEACSGLPGT